MAVSFTYLALTDSMLCKLTSSCDLACRFRCYLMSACLRQDLCEQSSPIQAVRPREKQGVCRHHLLGVAGHQISNGDDTLIPDSTSRTHKIPYLYASTTVS